MTGQYDVPATPAQIEQEMLYLLKQNRVSYEELCRCEDEYEQASAAWEIGKAKAYLDTHASQEKWTEARRAAYAVTKCEAERMQLGAATARVKAARAHRDSIRVAADLVRSRGTSVRSSLEMS